MSDSALVGQPPNTQEDYDVVVGFARVAGIPEQMFDPSKGFPMPLERPATDHYPSDYPDRAPRIIAAMSVAIVLAAAITGTRLGLRIFRKDLRFGWDDAVIVPAVTCVISWLGIVIGMGNHGGLGKHYYDVTYDEVYWFFRLSGVDQIVFYVAVSLIKISIVLFNMRLTGLTSARWMVAHNVFLIILVIYLLVGLFLNTLSCTPAGVQFSLIRFGSEKEAPHCLDQKSFTVPLSVLHIVFDFALLSVPLIVLSKVQMSLAKKLRIGFLFSVGSISCIGSVMRHVIQSRSNPDLTWHYELISWTTVDIFFAITAASLPVCNALVPKRWKLSVPSLPRLSYWTQSRRSGQNRVSVRLGSQESVDHSLYRPYGRAYSERNGEHTRRYTCEEAKDDEKTAPDGTVLPEVCRGSSLQQDVDIERFTTEQFEEWSPPIVARPTRVLQHA